MLHANIQDHGLLVLEKIFKGLAWLPSWSCDKDHFYNFLSPLPNEVKINIKFGFDCSQAVSDETFENCGPIHV